MQLSTGIEHLGKLVDSVKKMWAKMLLVLEGNYRPFYSICEDRPDLARRRHLISVSLDIAKYFVLPCGKPSSPVKYDTLKLRVEETGGPLCRRLNAHIVPSSSASCTLEGMSTFQVAAKYCCKASRT